MDTSLFDLTTTACACTTERLETGWTQSYYCPDHARSNQTLDLATEK